MTYLQAALLFLLAATTLRAVLLIGLAVLVWMWARRPPTDPEDREEIEQETKRW